MYFRLLRFAITWVTVAFLGFLYFRTKGFWGIFRRPEGMSNQRYFWRLWFRIGMLVLVIVLIKMIACYLLWGSGPWLGRGMGRLVHPSRMF